MTEATRQPGVADSPVGLARGTILVMAAEALAFPAGLVSTVLLTRHLPAPEFGALALALAGTAWLEWTIVSLFSRAAWKLIAESEDWRDVSAAVVRTFLLASLPPAVLVIATAELVATALRIPSLAPVLRVLAFEIPVFVTAHAYRTVLIGRSLHGSRAAVAAFRWTIRALLIAAGVLAGVPLIGIAVLIVMATTMELAIVRWKIVRARSAVASAGRSAQQNKPVTVWGLVAYAAPIAVSAICLRLFERIDIFALRALGGSMDSVAHYGVAQNLALGPGLFGAAFTPALIAALSYRLARGDGDGARRLTRAALRAGFLMVPFILLTAGAAPALVRLLFGAAYTPAAPLFALLVIGASGTLLMALASGVLVAAGRLGWTVALSAPLLLVATIFHLLLIPRMGALGAAIVTSATALAGAAAAIMTARILIGAIVPVATLLRGIVFGTVAGWAAFKWQVAGAAVLLALGALVILLVVAMCLFGELRTEERASLKRWTRSLLRPAAALP